MTTFEYQINIYNASMLRRSYLNKVNYNHKGKGLYQIKKIKLKYECVDEIDKIENFDVVNIKNEIKNRIVNEIKNVLGKESRYIIIDPTNFFEPHYQHFLELCKIKRELIGIEITISNMQSLISKNSSVANNYDLNISNVRTDLKIVDELEKIIKSNKFYININRYLFMLLAFLLILYLHKICLNF